SSWNRNRVSTKHGGSPTRPPSASSIRNLQQQPPIEYGSAAPDPVSSTRGTLICPLDLFRNTSRCRRDSQSLQEHKSRLLPTSSCPCKRSFGTRSWKSTERTAPRQMPKGQTPRA